MKSRDKPGRKEHESMMKKVKKMASSGSPENKVRMKMGMKKIKSLKKDSPRSY